MPLLLEKAMQHTLLLAAYAIAWTQLETVTQLQPDVVLMDIDIPAFPV